MTEWPPSAKPFRANPPNGTVGIVLPIRNDLRFFKLCYHSLLAFTDYRFMLTIVDNDSTIKTWQYLESIRRNHTINVLQYQKPHNVAAEWNLGLRFMFSFASVGYGVVLTPTVIFEPFWLSSTIRAIESQGVSAAVPATEGGSEDFLLFKRQAYESLGGFCEDPQESAMGFLDRNIQSIDGGFAVSSAFVHKFRNSGFDPKREPAAAPVQETKEATA